MAATSPPQTDHQALQPLQARPDSPLTLRAADPLPRHPASTHPARLQPVSLRPAEGTTGTLLMPETKDLTISPSDATENHFHLNWNRNRYPLFCRG
jgi:hypothetical protein